MKKLENKVAIIYGDGAVGSAVAVAFAREGAKVFFAGRTPEKLEAIANRILFDGGIIETAELDALDELAVEVHLSEVIRKAGKIDITFNAIGVPQTGIQGIALTELSVDSFILPITTYMRAHFITAKAAARRMTAQKNGVILMHTPNASRISEPFIGGMPPAWAAMEGLCRSLSVELGQHGIRAVALHTTAIPETPLIDEVFAIHGKSHGISYDQFLSIVEGHTHRKRLTTLDELANSAVFVASDEGSAITGTILNLTAGMITE